MAEKKANKPVAKKPAAKKAVQKPDKKKWNESLGGNWVDPSKIEFVNKPM